MLPFPLSPCPLPPPDLEMASCLLVKHYPNEQDLGQSLCRIAGICISAKGSVCVHAVLAHWGGRGCPGPGDGG